MIYFFILDRLPARAWWLVTAALLTVVIWHGTVVEVVTGRMSVSNLGDFLNCIGVLALWGLGLRRRFLRRAIWQYFLFLDVGAFVFSALNHQPEIEKYPLVLMAVFYLPYYLGMYTYAFRSDDLWHRSEQAIPNLARLALIVLVAAPLVFICINIHYWMTSEERHQRMSAIMDKIAYVLHVYEDTHGEYPESLQSLSFTNSILEDEMLADVRKLKYYRLGDGSCWLGYYYEDGGDSVTLMSAKNIHEARPSSSTNGASSSR